MLEHKLKQSLIYLYSRQGGNNWSALGRAIEWRLGIIRRYIKHNASFDEVQNLVSALTIQRQVETELDQYQQDLQLLSVQLQQDEISEDEFIEQVEVITAAVYFIACLDGSQTDNDNEAARRLTQDARIALDILGTEAGTVVDQATIEAAIPDVEARNGIDSQLAIVATSAVNFAGKLKLEVYDPQDLLFRIALWVNKALEMYSWGQLFRVDNPFYQWIYNPLKEHCDDCERLNGQVHTAREWYASGFWPRSISLDCEGWLCGCSFIKSNGPSQGDF